MFEQQNRICIIETPLGEDRLFVRRLVGTEAISRPFRYELELLSPDDALDLGALIGQPVLLKIDLPSLGAERFIHGLVSRFALVGADEKLAVYSAEVVPWIWLLSRRTDCRIFQNLTVPDIVKQVFGCLKLSDFELRLDGTYEPWVNCVQYRESDFAFVSRLLEEEGIFYFFEHSRSAHKLVLADTPGRNPVCPDQSRALYDPSGGHVAGEDLIRSWTVEHALQPGAYTMGDFNFLDPGTSLLVTANSTVPQGSDRRLEVYEYPGDYATLGGDQDAKLPKGDARLKLRRQAGEQEAVVIRGRSECRAFRTGHRFELLSHPRDAFNDTQYLLTEVRHDLTQAATFESGAGGGATWNSRYENGFVCQPHAVPFRPARVTPRPRVQGPQTAFVVGPKGEEIHVDQHGRVKVQFHWDRQSQADETSSCWIRVAQPWAGKQWGGLFIPRVGHEVVVEFLEGDPDRPLITGAVYNSVTVPPYPLPADATKSTLKSYSSKGGGGFNEICFEDKKGSELLFVRAEKDQDVRVQNDAREWIGNDRHLYVKKDQIEQVDNNRQEKVGADHIEEIGKDRHRKVVGKEAIEIGGSRSLKVTGDVSEAYTANHYAEVGQNLHLKAMSVVVEGMTKLTLKVGGSSVVIDPAGVTVKGSVVTIDGGMTKINSGPGSGPGAVSAIGIVPPTPPVAAAVAGDAAAGAMTQVTPHKPPQTPEEKARKTSWIEIELVDEDKQPVPGERYRIELADGSTAEGTLDEKGFARVEGIEPGSCKITFPNLDQDAWEKA
jgi:type VI secretion system secreted protein VgrG